MLRLTVASGSGLFTISTVDLCVIEIGRKGYILLKLFL